MRRKHAFFFLTCFLFLLRCAYADDTLAERFQNLPSLARGPCAVLRIDSLDADTALERMAQLSGMGFGGVLLAIATSDDTTWEKISKLANRASELRLELGIQDFPLSTNEPPTSGGTIDVFDEKAFPQHINKLLSGLQTRLDRHYGKTLTWILMKSQPDAAHARPQDLAELFFKQTGLRLAPSQLTLEIDTVGDPISAAYTKEKIALITADAWRTRFAGQARETVQEAGLEAGIMANELLMPPEEAANYFMRPVLFGCTTSATERVFNKRIANGAQAAARHVTIMGHLPLERVQPIDVPTQFASKHEMDKLFLDGATSLLLDSGATEWQDEDLFADPDIACLYARRWQFILQQSSPFDAPSITWQTRETNVDMRAITRKRSREHIYCIVNNSPHSGSITGIFPETINGTPPEYWSAENGEIIPLNAAVQTSATQTSIRLFIEPHGAFFVVFKQPAPPAN